MRSPRAARRFLRAEIVLALVLAAVTLMVWPVGDYAVDDDWAYARSLQLLREDGRFHILDWNPMTLVSHLLWGALWTLPLGFGMTAARLSTVALALAEALALAALLRRAGCRESTVILAGLALLLNPLHLFHGMLYATDVPASAWTALALLCYVRGLDGGSRRPLLWLSGGSLLTVIAFGVRQSGILLTAAVLTYLVAFDRRPLRRPRVLLASFLAPAAGGSLILWWYHAVHGSTAAYAVARGAVWENLGRMTPLAAAEMFYVLATYAAFFALPLWAAMTRWRVPSPRRPSGAVALGLGFLWVAMLGWLAAGRGRSFPYLWNKLTRYGYLSPNEVIVGARPELGSAIWGWGLTLLLVPAAVGFLLRWLGPGRGDRASGQVVARLAGVLLGWQLLYAGLTWGLLFDRHLLLLAPATLAVLGASLPAPFRTRPLPAALVLLAFGVYAVAGTHDLHAFSRAAFRAGRGLMDRGVGPDLIEAGYAFDGWHMYERSRRELLRQGRPPRVRAGDPWYVSAVAPRILSKFIVALSVEPAPRPEEPPDPPPWARAGYPGPGSAHYRPVHTVPYFRYWPWGRARVYVLEDTRLPPWPG